MAHVLPTDEQLSELEDKALSQSGISGDLAIVEIPEADQTFYVRSLSRPDLASLFNDSWDADERSNAQSLALYRATLFPTARAAITAAREAFPGVTSRVVEAIERLGGAVPCQWIAFDAKVTDDELAEYGIAIPDAADLRSRYRMPGQLWIGRLGDPDPDAGGPRVTLVLRRAAGTTHAALTSMHTGKTDRYQVALNAAVDCVLRPAPEELKALMREYPAIPSSVVLLKLLELVPGEGATGAKKLVRTGKRSGASK